MTAGWVIYFIVGAIICILFCYALLWIESGQISFDAISIIWAPEETYGYRIGYFGAGITGTPCFLFTGYLTGARINGDKQLLEVVINSCLKTNVCLDCVVFWRQY